MLKKITCPEGYLLTPWFFRYSYINAKIAIEAYGGGEKGRIEFLKDWSFWVICNECHKNLIEKFDWYD